MFSYYFVFGGRSFFCRIFSFGRNLRSYLYVIEIFVGREFGILRSRDCRGRGFRFCIFVFYVSFFFVRKNWYWRGCNVENGWRRRVLGR